MERRAERVMVHGRVSVWAMLRMCREVPYFFSFRWAINRLTVPSISAVEFLLRIGWRVRLSGSGAGTSPSTKRRGGRAITSDFVHMLFFSHA